MKKVRLVSPEPGSGKRIQLVNGWLHFYTPPARGSKVHAYYGQSAAYRTTFCGIDVPTETLRREREMNEEEMCEICLSALRRDHAKGIREVQDE